MGVHQGLVLILLLFLALMEALTCGAREGLPWETLYADDLALVAENMGDLGGRY